MTSRMPVVLPAIATATNPTQLYETGAAPKAAPVSFLPHIMKVLLIAPENRQRAKVIRWLQRNRALVVSVGVFPGIQLLQEIARTSPHLVVITVDQIDADTAFVLRFIEEQFQSLTLIRLPFDPSSRDMSFHWQDLLRAALKAKTVRHVPQPYAGEERLVFHDPEFNDFARTDKLSAGSPSLQRQTARLRQLLETGKVHHVQAKTYLEAIQASLAGLEQEIAYRVTHNSYKGLIWSRGLAAKYVAVLAHYVPGVEVRYLPPPGPVHSSIDYVSFYLGTDARYAIDAVTHLEVHPTVTELLIGLPDAIFLGQQGRSFLLEQTQVLGLAVLLGHIATAHVSLMDRWLDPEWKYGEPERSRKARREMKLFRDFWDLESLFLSEVTLPKLIEDFHRGKLQTDFSYPPAPTFAQFLAQTSTGSGK